MPREQRKSPPGFSVLPKSHVDEYNLPWEAAYGILLIRLNKAADEEGKRLGKFIIPDYPSEQEFLEMRRWAKLAKETASWEKYAP